MEKETKTYTVDIVPQDKSVTITVSGFFYGRLRRLFTDYSGAYDPRDFTKLLKQIHEKNGEWGEVLKDEDVPLFNLETLYILVRSLEEEFHNQNLTVKEDIEVEVDSKTQD
jgi:hypothetical protein